jgi:hypothetical protein
MAGLVPAMRILRNTKSSNANAQRGGQRSWPTKPLRGESMILGVRRVLLALLLAASLSPAAAGDSFPFGSTLMLDAAPMRGSKRTPDA